MPSRAGAIWTLVIGIVLMVLVAPIIFVVAVVSGIGMGSITDGSLYAGNGGTVVVDETGVIGVSPISDNGESCVLTAQDGTIIDMVNEDGAGIRIARGLAPGDYSVSCDGLADGENLVLFTGDMINSLVGSALSALGWSTAVGVLGLVLTIVGIVWLVRRNRARREYLYGRGY